MRDRQLTERQGDAFLAGGIGGLVERNVKSTKNHGAIFKTFIVYVCHFPNLKGVKTPIGIDVLSVNMRSQSYTSSASDRVSTPNPTQAKSPKIPPNSRPTQ
jgi:hypothetical protein